MPSLRIAHERRADLQHRSRTAADRRRDYRDGERRPGPLRPWADR